MNRNEAGHEGRSVNGREGNVQAAVEQIAVVAARRMQAAWRAGLMVLALMAGLLGNPAWAAVTVSLTTPVANSSYTQWSNVTLSANAGSTGGSIAKVDFYANNGTTNTLVGTAWSAPYNYTWNAGSEGRYQLTAVATDNLGVQTPSTAIAISVVAVPTVSLTSPAPNTVATAPGSFTLTATASNSNNSIARVEFYNGATLLGTATTAPYTYTWSNVAAGTYTLNAKAIDTLGQSSLSNYNTVTVATPPYVALSSPAANATTSAPGSFTLTANAWGTSSALKSVAFYSGTTLLGTVTAQPYSYTWNNVAAGSYSLTAVATDTNNISATSSAVNVTALTPQPPTVSLTAPAANSSYAQWANVTLSANAGSTGGSIAKVDFYANNGTANTLLGTVGYPPYNFIWNASAGGNYQITAVATDSLGAKTTSAATTISVVAVPTVSLTAPLNSAAVSAPGSFTLTATASNSNNSIARVEFYNGTTLLGTATTAPYTFTWSNIPAGTYTLNAKAIDTLGQSSLSNYNTVTVATPPYVALTSPAANATAPAPGSFTLTANAWGTASTLKQVDFYSGSTLLGTATTAPYSFTWANVPAGSYTITAKATDGNGLTATSASVSVTVTGSGQPPSVSLVSPSNGATLTAPGKITLTATASSTGSTIAKVDFYNGTTLLGTATTAPYTFTWNNVAAGTYSLTATATDAQGIATTSVPVSVTVNAASAQVYYIHTDQLDTPRQITDTAGNIVWDWQNTDPFGNNMPNENPSGLGTFKFDLRFPGMVSDVETGLFYNFYRDCYDPATGRYCQPDPIGLYGGSPSLYTYVNGNPLTFIDPLGLETSVTVWHPVGWGGSSFGHISTNINGTTYSFGTGGMSVMPTTDYLKLNDFREGTAVNLKLTPQQEGKLSACMSKSQGAYDKFTNNCGTPVQRCLSEVGVNDYYKSGETNFGINDHHVFPVDLGTGLLSSSAANGTQTYSATNPSTGSSAPWAR